MLVGEEIRIKEAERLRKTETFQKKLQPTLIRLAELKAACPHEDVVVLCSAYAGSLSYDFDDAHDELRLCLCCGAEETGPNFSRLKAPFRRFEFGRSRFREKLDATPLGKSLLATPLSELRCWVYENGYLCWNR